MTVTLREIEGEVRRLAAQIGAPQSLLPSFGRHEEDAHPHVEVDERGYHYVLVERGIEKERMSTHDLDELLYAIFATVTFSLAQAQAARPRARDKDSRRAVFRRQLELLSMLSPPWAAREAEAHSHTLRNHPFDDDAEIRADLCVAYRSHGHSPDAAWTLACERYPLPKGGSSGA